eukprot:CAMPEP_0180797650 /NCGR_PEP_ID=MMETSP1038_2-20121128/57498_1 /TAXON_ID=632150 /ORGANISM="Azadinium spinosum, Strain 3D9" /LENGTH=98 /DNA_ID=CAMNT_0022836955 /DNA_START=224 /DNA_END=516 /DNA_ORIENTATION=-
MSHLGFVLLVVLGELLQHFSLPLVMLQLDCAGSPLSLTGTLRGCLPKPHLPDHALEAIIIGGPGRNDLVQTLRPGRLDALHLRRELVLLGLQLPRQTL